MGYMWENTFMPKDINWKTATEEEIDAYLNQKREEENKFLLSLEAPLSNLSQPQEGEDFDHIADQIEKVAPSPSSAYEGLRRFGRRNNELREQTKKS